MKKLFLLFTVLTFGFTLSSCLDGDNSFSAPVGFVYIDNNFTQTFGISLYSSSMGRGGYIYSDNLKKMKPKHFYLFAFNWSEENGYTQIGDLNALNVALTTKEIEIDKTSLIPQPSTEPVEGQTKFKNIRVDIYNAEGTVIDDNWLLYYTYEGKEGEIPHVNFFKRETNIEKPNVIEIDVILTKTGTPKEGADEKELGNYITIDMGYLRHEYISSGTTDEIEIKLYYNYDEEKDESTELNDYNNSPFKMKKPQSSNS